MGQSAAGSILAGMTKKRKKTKNTEAPRGWEDPLDPKDWDSASARERRRVAKNMREYTISSLRDAGFTVDLKRRDMIVTCRHDGNFKDQYPATLDAYDNSGDRWFHWAERIRAQHIRHCGKES